MLNSVKKSKKSKWQKNRNLYYGLAFSMPWIIGFVTFTVYPLISSFIFSFTSYDMISSPVWVGLDNFRLIFNHHLFWTAISNTFYYALIQVPLRIVVSLALAVFLMARVKGIRIYRTIYYIPNLVSIVAVSLLFQWLFDATNGPINVMLSGVGISGPDWLNDPMWTKPSLILMSMWSTGATVLIFLAALNDVPADLYEAALIDGSGKIRTFFKITLPLISPAIYFNAVIGFIGAFQVFAQALIMMSNNGAGPGNSTFFFSLWIFDTAFGARRDMGLASAMAWILLVIISAFTLFMTKVMKRFVFYYGD